MVESARNMGWSPRRINWNSIHTRLLASYLLLATLGTSLMSGYILWSFYAYFMDTRQTDLNNLAAALSESVADALESGNIEQVRVITQRYGAPESVTVRVFSPEGTLLSTSTPEIDRQVTDWLAIPGIAQALKGQPSQGVAKGVLTREDRLYSNKPIVRNNELIGMLRISITLGQFQRQFARIIWTILGSLALTIFLCALISDRFARSLSKPIETMRSFAMRVGMGHFGDRLSIRTSQELDQLAAELNRMSERLASLDEERRAFLANVSHELRTPVSNVQVTVEALENGAVEEIELRDRFFQTIKDETKRLSSLIYDLLDLGRLEAGVVQLDQQMMSLEGLVNRAVRAMELRMDAKQLSVQVDVTDVQFMGDPERLLQALLNVLDNAIKHSQTGTEIFIAGRRGKNSAVLIVRDQGPGIPRKHLPHIFEQFYTTNASRNGNSTGLGLAIAKRIVEAQGGRITASSKAGEGATFTITLPL
ncbi:HAMP domain-containing histidine kinase [Leptolyngbya sp. NM3-A1]|nr:HAMP domain-containing sensor histidine kinase [Leptolyngbya sp. FACHB-16]